MSNTNTKQKTRARESVGLQDDCGTQSPQGTSRSCKPLDAQSCNTASPKYTTHQKIKHLRCAVDSLYVSFKGEIEPELEGFLSIIKLQAQDPNPDISSQAYVSIADHKFEMKPKGVRRFSYVLKDNWFSIQISNSSDDSQSRFKMPLAYIQISSELLTFTPLDEIMSHLTEIVSRIGKITEPPIISRLDLCMDFVPMFDVENIQINQWRTRATNIDHYHVHKRPTGWGIGKGAFMGRLYNKSTEILKSKKDYLKPIWQSQGWDGKANVWRMEFQVRRDFLKTMGINQPEDIPELSPMLWKYATTKWLKLVTPTNDSNEARWPTSKEWAEIANTCTTQNCEIIRTVSKDRKPKDDYLFIHGIAAISSFMAREGITDLGEALGEFLHQAEDYHLAVKDKPMADYLKGKAKEKTLRYNTELKE